MIIPVVSVVIPFYSDKDWLVSAINSVLSQTYQNFEVIVINDGSSEDIEDLEILFKERVIFIKQKNGGPAKARNKGILESKGKYIAFLDSDDIWMENKLEIQIAVMEEKNAFWSQHSYQMFWENKKRTKIVNTNQYQGNVFKDCYISFKVQTSTVVVRRDVIINNNIYFPKEVRYGQDLVFYKKLAERFELESVNEVLSKFRIRGSNAGFNAEIQLKNKADVWLTIKEDRELLNLLPNSIIWAYKNCYNKSGKMEKTKKTLIKNYQLYYIKFFI